MRPAERLDSFYYRLKRVHKKQFQDWRFGQFMSNVIQWIALEKKKDIWFPEEDEMINMIEEYGSNYGRRIKVTPYELAKKLDGNQAENELMDITDDDLVDDGLVVVYGKSDVGIEFHGALSKKFPMYGKGGVVCFDADGFPVDQTTGRYIGKNAITAKWYEKKSPSGDPFVWSFETDIPHEKFIIRDYWDRTDFCEGIVFSVDDLE